MNFRTPRRDRPELNLIPMIDVLIVLLIFLMLTTTFNREASMHIRLPEAGVAAQNEEKGLDIVIDAAGGYVVNKHQVINNQVDSLKKALREAAGENDDPLVVISADQKTPHQAVITALDAASQLGFVHITFAAMSTADEAP